MTELEEVPPMETSWNPAAKMPWELHGFTRLRRRDGSLAIAGRVVIRFASKAARDRFGQAEAAALGVSR